MIELDSMHYLEYHIFEVYVKVYHDLQYQRPWLDQEILHRSSGPCPNCVAVSHKCRELHIQLRILPEIQTDVGKINHMHQKN